MQGSSVWVKSKMVSVLSRMSRQPWPKSVKRFKECETVHPVSTTLRSTRVSSEVSVGNRPTPLTDWSYEVPLLKRGKKSTLNPSSDCAQCGFPICASSHKESVNHEVQFSTVPKK